MDFQRQACVIQIDRHKSLWLRAGGETHLLPSSLLLSCLRSLISSCLLSFFSIPFLSSPPSPIISCRTHSCPLPSHLVSSSVFCSILWPFSFFSPHPSSVISCSVTHQNQSPFLISSPSFFCLKSFRSFRSGAHEVLISKTDIQMFVDIFEINNNHNFSINHVLPNIKYV